MSVVRYTKEIDDIEQKVCSEALKLGVESVKWGDSGWPDRIFLTPGKPFFIEFKRPGGEPEPRQAFRIKTLKKLRYDVEVHDNVEEALSAIRKRLLRTTG